jgi:hypothetical protein
MEKQLTILQIFLPNLHQAVALPSVRSQQRIRIASKMVKLRSGPSTQQPSVKPESGDHLQSISRKESRSLTARLHQAGL